MSILSFAKYFSIDQLNNFHIDSPYFEQIDFKTLSNLTVSNAIAQLLLELFPIWEQSSKLRANPVNFEGIRVDYVYRRELPQSVICELEKLLSGGI